MVREGFRILSVTIMWILPDYKIIYYLFAAKIMTSAKIRIA